MLYYSTELLQFQVQPHKQQERVAMGEALLSYLFQFQKSVCSFNPMEAALNRGSLPAFRWAT